ncbi:putative retrotransposon gag domain-containing protein [Helianthus annuus]|nr:putative retrotransposon gag domain-containing protein [Helianthus annuus]
MSGCTPEQQVPYVSGLLQDGALLWWDRKVQELGEAVAYAMSWSELKEIMRKEYCSEKDIQGLELEFWELQKKVQMW